MCDRSVVTLSRMSFLLVPASTTTPSVVLNPSISTRSWLSVFSRSSLPPLNLPEPRLRPTASISSMNTMHGACARACTNRSRTRDGPTPTNISRKSLPLMEKNGTDASPAIAFANSVLPDHTTETQAEWRGKGDRARSVSPAAAGAAARHVCSPVPPPVCVTCARRSHEQRSLGYLGPEARELFGCFEEADELHHLHLGLVQPRHVVERHLPRHLPGLDERGRALAYGEDVASSPAPAQSAPASSEASAAHRAEAAHELPCDEHEQRHLQRAEHGGQRGALRLVLHLHVLARLQPHLLLRLIQRALEGLH